MLNYMQKPFCLSDKSYNCSILSNWKQKRKNIQKKEGKINMETFANNYTRTREVKPNVACSTCVRF